MEGVGQTVLGKARVENVETSHTAHDIIQCLSKLKMNVRDMTPAMIAAHNARVAQRKSEIGKKERVCENCGGQGWYAAGQTDNAVQLPCQFCSGTGKVTPAKPIPDPESGKHGEDRESKVRAEILAYCAKQWPKWIVGSPRPDVPSTMPNGWPDMVIFGPCPKVIICELKSPTGKPSTKQRDFAALMKHLGWTVHVIRSIEEFMSVVDKP